MGKWIIWASFGVERCKNFNNLTRTVTEASRVKSDRTNGQLANLLVLDVLVNELGVILGVQHKFLLIFCLT